MFTKIRQSIAEYLRRLAEWLSNTPSERRVLWANMEEPASAPPAHWLQRVEQGPPEHWLARVRSKAPQLLNDEALHQSPLSFPSFNQSVAEPPGFDTPFRNSAQARPRFARPKPSKSSTPVYPVTSHSSLIMPQQRGPLPGDYTPVGTVFPEPPKPAAPHKADFPAPQTPTATPQRGMESKSGRRPSSPVTHPEYPEVRLPSVAAPLFEHARPRPPLKPDAQPAPAAIQSSPVSVPEPIPVPASSPSGTPEWPKENTENWPSLPERILSETRARDTRARRLLELEAEQRGGR